MDKEKRKHNRVEPYSNVRDELLGDVEVAQDFFGGRGSLKEIALRSSRRWI